MLFLSGTRADFGKIKPLICALNDDPNFDVTVFVTGMHLHQKYGMTINEIRKSKIENIFPFFNYTTESTMDLTLAKTIEGLSSYIREHKPDMIVVHGDRVEALAGAIAGALNNILVAHVEGGEVSGTIDELIRHSTSKMSHIHFVCNQDAKKRLIQMGECEKNIFIIGSPDIDVMTSDTLPTLQEVKNQYHIDWENYAILIYHPVTTEVEQLESHVRNMVDAVIQSNRNYIVISPNNDVGSSIIFSEYKRLEGNDKFDIFPSMRFENFLVLLKHSDFIIGNSSTGIREAPYFQTPTINIGTRQNGRLIHPSIINCNCDSIEILQCIDQIKNVELVKPTHDFGDGKSVEKFISVITKSEVWKTDKQKIFIDKESK